MTDNEYNNSILKRLSLYQHYISFEKKIVKKGLITYNKKNVIISSFLDIKNFFFQKSIFVVNNFF